MLLKLPQKVERKAAAFCQLLVAPSPSLLMLTCTLWCLGGWGLIDYSCSEWTVLQSVALIEVDELAGERDKTRGRLSQGRGEGAEEGDRVLLSNRLCLDRLHHTAHTSVLTRRNNPSLNRESPSGR